MNAALAILALLFATAEPRQPATINGGRFPSPGLDFSEFVIDTGVTLLRVAQSRASVAFDGANYFGVWQDARGSTSPDIYGARVTPSGEILDLEGIAICTTYNQQSSPCVASLDSMYLVVWYDRRDENSGDIYGTRVTRSGRVLDPAGIEVCRAQGAQEFPVVAAGDTCWFVAWQDNRTEWDIRGTCVSRSGVVKTPGGFAVGAATGQQSYPAAAFNGENFLVVWQSNQYGPLTLWGTRVTQTGQVLDPGGFLVAGDISQNMEPTAASVAAAGEDFLVAWQNVRTPKHVFAKRVSGGGVPQDPVIPLPATGATQQNPSVASVGTTWLVTWEDQRGGTWDIYGARVSSDGVVADSTGIPLTTGRFDQYEPTVAGGSRWLAAWTDKALDPNVPVVHGIVIDTDGVPAGPDFRVGSLAPFYCGQMMPALAASPDGYLAAWEAGASVRAPGSTDFYTCCARLDPDGRMLDSTPITLAGITYDSVPPAISCGDSNWMVARSWIVSGMGICAARVGFDGTVLDPTWIALSSAGATPSVAFDGTNYLVAWAESKDIYGARVTQSGTVLDRIPIATTSSDEKNPAVSFDGTNCLVTWQSAAVQYQDVIRGARVTTEGVLLDSNGFLINGSRSWDPAVAYNGTNYLVVWVDYRTTWWEIFGTRISPAGQVLDSAGIMISRWGYEPTYESDPCVSSDGSSYVVLWKSDYNEAELRGTAINAAGVRTDTFVLPVMPMNSPSPACAYGQDARFLAIFSAVKDPNGGGRDTLSRIWGSFVSPDIGLSEATKETRGRAALSINPNPFTRALRFQLGPGLARPDARLTIRDAAGRCVRTFMCAQNGVLNWNGTDAAGHRLPAGIYFCTLRSGGMVAGQKLTKLE